MSTEAQARDELAKIIGGETSFYERPVFDAISVATALHAWAKNHGYVKQERLASLEAALAEAKRERDDLAEREREVTCVWCGYQFESTLKSQADHLYQHAQTCEKHPVRALTIECDALRAIRDEVCRVIEEGSGALVPGGLVARLWDHAETPLRTHLAKAVEALKRVRDCAHGIMPIHKDMENLKQIIISLQDARWTRLYAILSEANAALDAQEKS